MSVVSRATLAHETCSESEGSESTNDWSTSKQLNIDQHRPNITVDNSRESISHFYNSSLTMGADSSSKKSHTPIEQYHSEIKNLQPVNKYFGKRRQVNALRKIEASNGVLIEADQLDAYEYLLQSSSEFSAFQVKHLPNATGIAKPSKTQPEIAGILTENKEKEPIDFGGNGIVQRVRKRVTKRLLEDDDEFQPDSESADAEIASETDDSDDSGSFYEGQKEGGNSKGKERRKTQPSALLSRKSDGTSKTKKISVTNSGTARKQQAKKKRRVIAGRACSNCNAMETPVWRRSPEGKPICNACGVFAKVHGHVRPIELRKDVVYTRTRKTEKASEWRSLDLDSE
ncbi:hypothetical protein HK100_007956 [Physocladia obscura]|uniref:GATA-type domain-containing protein n=1 Tax=Physocladia obscura TaxID=109957 RepID=A0AAD5TC03_9FUNG|nr:hypothetical protein HK100_007956 [Physocladia obscura]